MTPRLPLELPIQNTEWITFGLFRYDLEFLEVTWPARLSHLFHQVARLMWSNFSFAHLIYPLVAIFYTYIIMAALLLMIFSLHASLFTVHLLFLLTIIQNEGHSSLSPGCSLLSCLSHSDTNNWEESYHYLRPYVLNLFPIPRYHSLAKISPHMMFSPRGLFVLFLLPWEREQWAFVRLVYKSSSLISCFIKPIPSIFPVRKQGANKSWRGWRHSRTAALEVQ
jgi:hypothetical protein